MITIKILTGDGDITLGPAKSDRCVAIKGPELALDCLIEEYPGLETARQVNPEHYVVDAEALAQCVSRMIYLGAHLGYVDVY